MTSQITIVGRLTDDPTIRFTPGGDAVASFTVAVNERKRQGADWVDDGASFYQCQTWRGYAENVTESLAKGDHVIVTGGLKQRQWETKDGEKRSSWEVQVDEVGPALRWATAKPVKGKPAASAPKPGGWGSAPAADPWANTSEAPF